MGFNRTNNKSLHFSKEQDLLELYLYLYKRDNNDQYLLLTQLHHCG